MSLSNSVFFSDSEIVEIRLSDFSEIDTKKPCPIVFFFFKLASATNHKADTE